MNRKVVIVGAGLVGSLWAVLLRRRNFEVSVFERRPDIRNLGFESGRSINLVITSRGLYGLEQAGLLRQAYELSVPVYGRMIHPKIGNLVYQPYGQKDERNLSVSRSELNRFLLNAAESAGAQLKFDHTLDQIDLDKKLLSFQHEGATVKYEYDLLFGTDGSGSPVRKSLNQKNQNVADKIDWLSAEYKELFMPTGSGLDPNALHIWARGSHMMMALANLDKSFTITLYLPKEGPFTFSNLQTETQIQKFFEAEFPDATRLMPNYLKDFLENPVGSLGTVRCKNWVWKDSVALMGDAAHAIVPFFGQGMNSGFEDCTNLLKIMDSTQDWKEILAKYNQTQPPNAEAIADMAIENWFEMSSKVADPKFQLQKKVESIIEKTFPEQFKSRYGMVTYTLIPYKLIQEAGLLQSEILSQLCQNITGPEELEMGQVKILLEKKYAPFLKEHKIELKTYLG